MLPEDRLHRPVDPLVVEGFLAPVVVPHERIIRLQEG
jgi:hypothetical protein